MKPRIPRFAVTLVFALVATFGPATAAPLRVLYFTKSSGFEHSVVKRENGRPSYSEKVLTSLGERHDMTFTYSKDGSLFTPDYLRQFDVLLFYTSGDLTSVGTDGQPAIDVKGLAAFFDFVAGGGGLVALHSASDTFHSQERGGGNNPRRRQRYHLYGPAADPYVKLLGGEFIRHGPQQVAHAAVVDPKFPGFSSLGADLNVNEEWYTLKEFAPDDHVLLVMRTAGMQGGDYLRPDYPLAWARNFGQGRVAYNAMGHRDDVWDSAAYQSMLVGMLNWAGRRSDAALTPNLAQVTPGNATLQAPPAEVKE